MFTGTITAILLGTLIWTIVVLAPFLHVTIDIKTTESTVNVSSCGYTSSINIDDIIELKLMDKLPDDHFSSPMAVPQKVILSEDSRAILMENAVSTFLKMCLLYL